MKYRIVFLWSDVLLFLSFLMLIFFVAKSYKKELNRQAIKRLLSRKIATVSFVILFIYSLIALLDSLHFQVALPKADESSETHYSTQSKSVLDSIFSRQAGVYEKTYSAPFSLTSYVKESQLGGEQFYPKLRHIESKASTNGEVVSEVMMMLLNSLVMALILMGCIQAGYSFFKIRNMKEGGIKETFSKFYFSFFVLVLFVLIALYLLSSHFHILGTGKVGQDIFYYGVKSIRTGLVIGVLTTLVTLPFALTLGIAAGYFGGKIDDFIQYIYIVISSVPGVLLIAASVLSMQVFIANHPEFFTTLGERSDARLISLCIILGLTGWTSLCRMLRAESLKIREIDYIQAAIALGSRSRFIIFKHILPNVMHLVLIATVLDFSFLVLAEAVLSYIGVGVSPLTISWGNMINGARLELAREPIVWWPMFAAFIFMFMLVLATNLFADQVRDVFDPRSEH